MSCDEKGKKTMSATHKMGAKMPKKHVMPMPMRKSKKK